MHGTGRGDRAAGGGELTQRFGWRAVFAANLPVIAVSLLLVMMSRGMYTRATDGRPSFDWPGSALLACGLTLTSSRCRCPGAPRGGSAESASSSSSSFPLWERRAASPVVDFSLLKRSSFFGGGSIIALQNMAMYPLLFQLPVFFDRVRHLGARTMGQALLALTLAMMVSSVAGGRLTERIGARAQTLAGSLVALAGLYWFADFEIRERAAGRHAWHGADGPGVRPDVAAGAGRVDEHGRARAVRDGRRHRVDDAGTSAAWRAPPFRRAPARRVQRACPRRPHSDHAALVVYAGAAGVCSCPPILKRDAIVAGSDDRDVPALLLRGMVLDRRMRFPLLRRPVPRPAHQRAGDGSNGLIGISRYRLIGISPMEVRL